jgi:FMN phosphatase YigB (HAD superfamily)
MNAILLDFGGTIDTDGLHWGEKFHEAYTEAGLLVPEHEFDAAYSRAEAQMGSGVISVEDGLRRTLETQVTLQLIELGKGRRTSPFVAPADAARGIAERCVQDVLETVRQNVPLLQRWSRDYTLALVSNFYGNLVSVIRGLGIAEYFRAVIDSAVVGVRKPDPRIFRHALDALGCSPADALVVGDSYDRDIVPAKSLGCATVWLQHGFEDAGRENDKADFIIPTLSRLDSILTERITHEDRT